MNRGEKIISQHSNEFDALQKRVIPSDKITSNDEHPFMALKRMGEQAQLYFDIAGVMLIVLGGDEKVHQINHKGCEILGCKESEIVGKNWFDSFILPDKRDQVRAVFRKGISGEVESVEYFENSVLTKKKEVRIIAWHNTLLKDDIGKIIGTLSSGEDITERKRVQEALQASQYQQKAILNSIPDIAWLKDEESRFIAVNEPFGKACGFKPKDIVGKTDLDLWPEDLANIYRADDKKVMKTRKRVCVEEPLEDKAQGKRTWIETIKTPIYNDDGEVVGTSGIARDVSVRKQLEEHISSRLSFERTVATISSRFVGAFDIDKAVTSALSDMGLLSNSDRAYLFLFRDNHKYVDNTHEWCFKGVSSQKERLQGLLSAHFPWWMSRLKEGKMINYNIEDLPKEAVAERKILELREVNAVLFFPLKFRKELAGFIGFDDIKGASQWKEDDFLILRISSEIIGNALERRLAEDALKSSEALLREQKIALERKNLALKEILEQIEIEKKQIKDNVIVNTEKLLLPTLQKLRKHVASRDKKYVEILEKDLEELTSSFGNKIASKSLKLTPREIEICNMIKSGLTSKEIAGYLNISSQTIDRHRNNIRSKLGLAGKSVNLITYLQIM